MYEEYSDFFKKALNLQIDPYPYQTRLALNPWPHMIDVPTGIGKTAAAILAWLYKRYRKDISTPRRLIYCLPLRGLVEQTINNTRYWIDNLIVNGVIEKEQAPKIYTLMGGRIEKDWDCYPEDDAFIVGTQDQLLSRALNRGYCMSRFRWPVDFGLLNNDCLWIMDEIQLMGPGLSTTTQLEAFRRTMGTSSPCHSIWMSATLQSEWLGTVDFRQYLDTVIQESLSEEDLAQEAVLKRTRAVKQLYKARCDALYSNNVASLILDKHKHGTKTLVVVNTVKRAQEVYLKIDQLLHKKMVKPEVSLVHSRYRPSERQKALNLFLQQPGESGSICIATQVVEAGLDMSAHTLITDLAPWASLVQRFGRCNRYGEFENAQIYWLDIMPNGKGRPSPYEADELGEGADQLAQLEGLDVCPNNLPAATRMSESLHVLRKKDIMDLFDTTPDLAGMDIDISRFIREPGEYDVKAFWRNISKDMNPLPGENAPVREELCGVPMSDLKEWDYWIWDHIEKRWIRPIVLSPGMEVMLRHQDGGYNATSGWTGNKKDIPNVLDIAVSSNEGDEDDPWVTTSWQTLIEHTDKVVEKTHELLAKIDIGEFFEQELLIAARWHDAGKTHKVFRQAMVDDSSKVDIAVFWAKTSKKKITYSRRGFRHELASALALLENNHSDLSAYLAAAHHGKVRMSIRSLPHELRPSSGSIRFARGIWNGDPLPEASLGGGETLPKTCLNLSYMDIGESEKGASWLMRMLALRDSPTIGIFRLAYLEALLRCSDWKASKAGDHVE